MPSTYSIERLLNAAKPETRVFLPLFVRGLRAMAEGQPFRAMHNPRPTVLDTTHCIYTHGSQARCFGKRTEHHSHSMTRALLLVSHHLATAFWPWAAAHVESSRVICKLYSTQRRAGLTAQSDLGQGDNHTNSSTMTCVAAAATQKVGWRVG